MLQSLIGNIWRKLPQLMRLKIIRISQKKFTVSVGAVIFDENEHILLLDHVLRPKSGWGIPGGFINENEHPEQAVKRELDEETGLQLENIKLWRVQTKKLHVEFIFIAEGNGRAEVKSLEIKAVKWFKADSLPNDLPFLQKQMIDDVLKFTGRK